MAQEAEESQMKRLSKANRALLNAENARAEEFLCSHVKATGEVEQIKDGKHDVFVNLKWPDLVSLLSRWGIQRMADLAESLEAGKS